MTTFVTPTGLVKKTLPELKAEFEAAYVAAFGSSLDLDPSGPWGQHIGIMSKAFADLWDLVQEIYVSRDPDQATGLALDAICAETGLSRIGANQSVVTILATGSIGTIIGLGKKIKQPNSSLLWSMGNSVIVAVGILYACRLEPATPSNGLLYELTINSQTFTYAATGSDTKATVVAQFVSLISGFFGAALSVVAAGNVLAIGYSAPGVLSPPSSSFSQPSRSNFSFLDGTVSNIAVAAEPGPFTASAGSLTEIVTPVSGWTSVYNAAAAIPGRLEETDDELRLRRRQSFLTGKSTEDAIEQALLSNVPGIASAVVFSNRTMTTDGEGRPPKSFEAIVVGGTATPDEIAQVIWDSMPAGIEPYGNVTATAVDRNGDAQTVKYSTPLPIYLWIRISYSVYSEEAFGGVDAIKAAVLAWSLSEYTLGKDIIPGRIAVPVYSVPGLGAVQIQVKTTPTPTDDGSPYGSSTIPVGGRYAAQLTLGRIDVVAL